MAGKHQAKLKSKKKKTASLERLGSKRVFNNSLLNWFLLAAILVMVAGLTYLIIREYGQPPRTETFIAEVSKMWIEEVQNETGGYRLRQIQLNEGDKKFTCSLSPGMDKLWYQLEVGESYEISISRSLHSAASSRNQKRKWPIRGK